MSLLEFCASKGPFTRPRERLLHHKAVYELKLEAAKIGRTVQVSEPEIDDLGHDFVLSVERTALHVQNKAVIMPGGAEAWDIHAAHLTPGFPDRDVAPLVDGLPLWWPTGAAGVVLLHEVDRTAAGKGELRVRYGYFDLFYAAAVAHGFFDAPGFRSDRAMTLLRSIFELRDERARIGIPRAAFLPVASPGVILQLRFGMPSPSNFMSVWRDATGARDAQAIASVRGQLGALYCAS